jgi:hypothetical protein
MVPTSGDATMITAIAEMSSGVVKLYFLFGVIVEVD